MLPPTRCRTLAIAVALALAWPVAGEAPPEDRLGQLRELIVAGKHADAEAQARDILATVEAASGADSVEAASVIDLLVESLWRAGKSRLPEAERLARRAVEIRERASGPDDPSTARSLTGLANVLSSKGDAAARPLFERALGIFERALGPDHPHVAATLGNLANELAAAGDYAAAKPLFERSLAIRERALGPDHPDVAASLTNLGLLLRMTGDLAAARAAQERARSIHEKAFGDEHPAVAADLSNLALVLRRMGLYGEARRLLERALVINEKTLGADHPETGRTLHNLGNTLREMGAYAAARPLLERALAIRERALGTEHPGFASSLDSLAGLLERTGDYAASRALQERALAIRERVFGADNVNVAISLSSLGLLLFTTGDYAAAKPLFERALSIHEQALGTEHPDVARDLDDLAGVYWRTGDRARAKQAFERALAISEKVQGPDHPDLAITLANLAGLLVDSGDYAGALPLCERSLAIQERSVGADHPHVAAGLSRLAQILQATGKPLQARPLLERALAIRSRALGADHPSVAGSLSLLARAEAALGDSRLALDHALEAERIAREHLRWTGRSLSEREALQYAAAVRVSGLDLALSLVAGGLDAASRRRVFDAVARSRAIVLDEMGARNRAAQHGAGPDVAERSAALAAARSRLANLALRGIGEGGVEAYRRALDEARTDAERAERALAESSAEFALERSRARIGVDEVASSLPPASALVAFTQYRRIAAAMPAPSGRVSSVPSYLGFVLRPGASDPLVIDLGPAAELDALVLRWKDGVAAGGDEASVRDAGVRLRRAVWDPVARALDGERVFVVPDGALNLVNLAALPRDAGGYLVEHGPLVHHVSAERDLVPSGERRHGDGLLVLGNPAYDATSSFAARRREDPGALPVLRTGGPAYRGQPSSCPDFASLDFGPLGGTELEASEVARLWGQRGAVARLGGEAATEAALKQLAPGRQVLHLATHGFFLGEACGSALAATRGIGGLAEAALETPLDVTPRVAGESPLLRSGLVLAGANHRATARGDEDDGILTAEEIASLDLGGVEWAVLSACETGLGDVRAGEGVLGLRRAFQIAGAGTLIMSLWPVDDEATRWWMKALYEGRFVRGLGTAEAMRQASLAVLAERRGKGASTHPFYWGAFVAVGDWR